MTREELRDYVDEQRTLDNIPYHVYSVLIDGIDALEQEPKTGHWEENAVPMSVIEDIKAEIKELPYQRIFGNVSSYSLLDTVLEIIDKHIERSE